MSAHEQNPKEKAATLTLALRAGSGYEADARLSPAQRVIERAKARRKHQPSGG